MKDEGKKGRWEDERYRRRGERTVKGEEEEMRGAT